MHALYNLSIYLYLIGIRIAALFHPKALLWVNGRRKWQQRLQDWREQNPGELVWFHCASLGEFEQGRPVIEAFRKEYPGYKILLTFFSPSGYEIRKNYTVADLVAYLPADTPLQSGQFIDIMRPKAAFVVKYEYWANLFFQCKRRGIPVFMLSAILRADQRFFGLFSSFWSKVLSCVTRFFVQDQTTLDHLKRAGFHEATITGDTRFDRVVALTESAPELPVIASFIGKARCIVAGSTWQEDERVLQQWYYRVKRDDIRLIIVPHEIGESHIHQILDRFRGAVRWTAYTEGIPSDAQILVIDTIGLLSSVYRYADVVLIGGGFGAGIHNTLEAAVWGVPVVFGPQYGKFAEANELIRRGAGFSGRSIAEVVDLLDKLMSDAALSGAAGQRAGDFVRQNGGATALIMSAMKNELPIGH